MPRPEKHFAGGADETESIETPQELRRKKEAARRELHYTLIQNIVNGSHKALTIKEIWQLLKAEPKNAIKESTLAEYLQLMRNGNLILCYQLRDRGAFYHHGPHIPVPPGIYQKNTLAGANQAQVTTRDKPYSEIAREVAAAYLSGPHCTERFNQWLSLHSVATIMVDERVINYAQGWIKNNILTPTFMETHFRIKTYGTNQYELYMLKKYSQN